MKALLVEQHSDKLSAGVQHIDESQLLFMRSLLMSTTRH